MANGFQYPKVNLQRESGLYKSLQDVGSSLGEFAKQKQAMQLKGMAQKQSFQQQIDLIKLKNELEQQDPFRNFLKKLQVAQVTGMPLNEIDAAIGAPATAKPSQKAPGQVAEPKVGQGAAPSLGQTEKPDSGQATGGFGQFKPTTAERSPLTGDLVPGGFKAVMSPQEKAAEVHGELTKAINTQAVKASGKQIETILKTTGNLSRVESAMSGLVGQAKRAVNEQGGFGAQDAIMARIKRFGQRITGAENVPLAKQFGGLAGLDAQRQEVILSLSPILTNSNRVLRSAITMIKKTVPDLPITGTTEADFGENVRQSMKNSFRLSVGIAKGLLTPQKIADLEANASDEAITEFLKSVIDRTRFTQQDEELFKEIFDRVMATPATKPVGLFQEGERQFRGFNLKDIKQGKPSNLENVSESNIKSIKPISR